MRIPSPEEVRDKLTPEQIAKYEQIGQTLQAAFGPVPPGFHLTGWLWANLSEAQRIGWDSDFVTVCLNHAYIDLVGKLTSQAKESRA